MYTQKFTGLVAGLLVGVLSVILPLQAHELAYHGVVKADNILLTLKLDTLNRASVTKLCKIAITEALNEAEFDVVTSGNRADAELVVTGGILTITEGRAGQIGNAQLSYSIELKDMHGHTIMSQVADAEGDSAAELCTDVGENIAEELEEALDD
jgi:hypothetical protein